MIDNLYGWDLKEYILSLSKNERLKILQDDNIRNRIISIDSNFIFPSLMNSLEDSEVEIFIDNNFLDKIIASEEGSYLFQQLMLWKKESIINILSSEKAISAILNDTSLYCYLRCTDYKIGQRIIDYDLKYNKSYSYLIGEFYYYAQKKILNSEYIIKLLQCNIDSKFLNKLDGKLVANLIKYPKFLAIFLNLDVEIIYEMITDRNLVIPKHLINNTKLINKFSYIMGPRYRFYVDKLKEFDYNFYLNIEKSRLKYISNKFKVGNEVLEEYGINTTFLFDKNKADKNEKFFIDMRASAKKISKYELLEDIIEVLFEDIPYNCLINIRTMLEYCKNNHNVKLKNMELYQKILDFNNLSVDEIKGLFNKYVNTNTETIFYEDFRKCRDIAYRCMNEKILDVNKHDELYDKELSKKYGVDIYLLTGEDFYLYVHAARYKQNINSIWKTCKDKISISLIGHENITTFNQNNLSTIPSIVFGFKKLNVDSIIHVYNSDLHSNFNTDIKKYQRLYSADDLLKQSIGHNEILYSEKNLDNFKPDYIISFDYPKRIERDVALYMGIPIIVINSTFYKRKLGMESKDANVYVSSVLTLNRLNYNDILNNKRFILRKKA